MISRDVTNHVGAPAQAATVQVVGINESAWQKALSCETTMIYVERGEVVDVRPDHSAEPASPWLEQHPGIEIASGDCRSLCAERGRQDGQQPKQAADHFHRLKISGQRSRRRRAARFGPTGWLPSPANTEPKPVIVDAWIGHGRQSASVEYRQLISTGPLAASRDKSNVVKATQLVCHGVTATVRQKKFDWRTLVKWVRLDALPEPTMMEPKPNTPSGFDDYIARRRTEDCTSGLLLLEIGDLGYTGSLSHSGHLPEDWRFAGRAAPTALSRARQAVTVDTATTAAPSLIDPLARHFVAPTVTVALCVKLRGLITESHVEKVDAFKTISLAFSKMRAIRLRGVLRGSDVERLTFSLHNLERSTVYGIYRFAHTLRQDVAAVRYAITETCINGQTHGQIKRLKTLLRAINVRYAIDLLRAQIISSDPPELNELRKS